MRIKDNFSIPKKELEQSIPNLLEEIANKSLGRLRSDGLFIFPESLQDTEDLSENQMILRSVDDDYRTGNVMGFIGYNNNGTTEQLAICSRFSDEEQDFFLQYLLNKVLNFPNIFKFQIDGDPNKQILDLITFLFPIYLKKAVRKGLFKMYQQKKYNDSNPKGVIDVARHIKQNVPFTGKVSYNRREYTYDNYLMELIRHTIECIKGKSYGKQVLYMANDEVKAVIEATANYQRYNRQKILSENLRHTVRHAYYHEYRDLQKLCILILQNQKQGFGTNNHRIYGILFDGAWLWEEYVNTLISEWFYHPKNKKGEGYHHLFQGGNGKIFPDFIGKDKKSRIIADAKYKPIQNIDNNDYYQVLAYMMRFDAKKGLYFYPKGSNTEKSNTTELHLLCGSRYEDGELLRNDIIGLNKIGFCVPHETTNDYNLFCKAMQESEKKFFQELKKHSLN